MNYKQSVNLEKRIKFSKRIISKCPDLIPVIIESDDYNISKYIGTLNRKWINKEYYKKTELQYILLDVLKNVFINNIVLEPNQTLDFKICSKIFPANTKLEEIYNIYKDNEDNILYLTLINVNSGFIPKIFNWIKMFDYYLYKIRKEYFKQTEKYESPYTEI